MRIYLFPKFPLTSSYMEKTKIRTTRVSTRDSFLFPVCAMWDSCRLGLEIHSGIPHPLRLAIARLALLACLLALCTWLARSARLGEYLNTRSTGLWFPGETHSTAHTHPRAPDHKRIGSESKGPASRVQPGPILPCPIGARDGERPRSARRPTNSWKY